MENAPYLVRHQLCLFVFCAFADDPPQFSDATTDANGFLVHEVTTQHQGGKTRIRVLMPSDHVAGNRPPVIYVLPVEQSGEHRYGDGLLEIKKHDLHVKYRAVFVAPDSRTFPGTQIIRLIRQFAKRAISWKS